MYKKIMSLFVVFVMVVGLVGCQSKSSNSNKSSTSSSVKIKTVDDFKESAGLVKYYTIEDKKFAIPETVGEYANYLAQLGTVTLNETGKSVDEATIDANGVSSMVSYLNVETDDGENQRFLVRYENKSKKEIPVAEAKITRIEVKYDPLSEMDYEKVFDSITVVTDKYTYKMDGKTNLHKFWDILGNPEHETDGRLDYEDDLGYKYTFDCCNELRNGIFRGFIISYPSNNK